MASATLLVSFNYAQPVPYPEFRPPALITAPTGRGNALRGVRGFSRSALALLLATLSRPSTGIHPLQGAHPNPFQSPAAQRLAVPSFLPQSSVPLALLFSARIPIPMICILAIPLRVNFLHFLIRPLLQPLWTRVPYSLAMLLPTLAMQLILATMPTLTRLWTARMGLMMTALTVGPPPQPM
jgi:hypothetical protein